MKRIFIIFLLFSSILKALEVKSEFSPPVISLGTQSQYKLIIINGSNESLRGEIPVVKGLEIEKNNPIPSTHVSIVNGQQEVQKSYGFTATPRKEGSYTLPSWKINVGGKDYTVPAATLKVVPPGEEFNNSLFMKVLPEKKEVYVGESIPTVIKLYLRGDISASILGDGLTKQGDAFAQSDIPDQFQQKTENVDGQTYKVAMWPVTLTPVKPGVHEITYTLDLMVDLPDQNNMRRRDPFSGFGSLFDDMLGRRNRKEIALTSQEITFNVKEIPSANRPDGFTGAVGEFMTSTSIDNRSVKAGEPITLTVEMTGEGNFNRILAPEIPEDENFRIYPPKTSFTESHDTGLTGTKKIEYIIIPKNNTVTETPVIPFSYFDPQSESFQDISIPAIPIDVKTNPNQNLNRPSLPTSVEDIQKSATQISQTENTQDPLSIYPIKQSIGKTTKQISPPVYKVSFWIYQSLLGLLLLTCLIALNYKKLKNDPVYRIKSQNRKTVKSTKESILTAYSSKNASSYFENIDKLIRLQFAHYFPDRNYETINEDLISNKMKELQLPENSIEFVRKSMIKNQSIKFSQGLETVNNWEEWSEDYQDYLKSIAKLK